MTNPPAWLTEKGVTVYAIPKGTVGEGVIKFGDLVQVTINYDPVNDDDPAGLCRDAFAEAWERFRNENENAQEDAMGYINRPVPDGHVWLVRRACPNKNCDGGKVYRPENDDYVLCHCNNGHVHVLVREDAEQVRLTGLYSKMIQTILRGPNFAHVAGLRAIRPERKCDRRLTYDLNAAMGGHGKCSACNGTGTLSAERWDCWR